MADGKRNTALPEISGRTLGFYEKMTYRIEQWLCQVPAQTQHSRIGRIPQMWAHFANQVLYIVNTRKFLLTKHQKWVRTWVMDPTDYLDRSGRKNSPGGLKTAFIPAKMLENHVRSYKQL